MKLKIFIKTITEGAHTNLKIATLSAIALALAFVVMLTGTTYAFSASHNFPIEIQLQANTARELCNVTLNATENETITNMQIFFAGAPLNVTYAPLPTTITNQTYNFCLNMTAPPYIPRGNYLNSFYIASNSTPLYLNYNVSILESMNWTVMTDTFNSSINTGSSQVIPIIIRNDGNSIFELVTTITGNASNVSSISTNVMSYPMLNSTLTLQFNVPKSYPVGDYYGDILISTKNAPPEDTRHLNFTLQIYDQLPPIVYSITAPAVMATKPTTITVTADDNLAIQSVMVNISHNITASDLYPIVVNVTTNETIWQTRYFNQTVTDVADLTLQLQPNTNIYQANFERTDVITTYFVNILTTDQSNNTVANYTTFEVKPLNALVNYTNYATLKTLKKPYGLIYESDYGTPLTLTLKNVTYNGNYTFEVYDQTGGLRGILNNIGQSVTLQDTGPHYLKVIGDAKSDRFGSTTDGYLSALFSWQVIPQHVPIADLTVSGTVIDYEIPQPFNRSWGGQQFTFEPIDTGDFYSSGLRGCVMWPAGTLPEDLVDVPATLKERNESMQLMAQCQDSLSGARSQNALFLFGLILFVTCTVVYHKLIKDWLQRHVFTLKWRG